MTLRRTNNPFWMTAKFDGTCRGPGCGQEFQIGEEIYYNPVTKKAFAHGCGIAAEQRFLASRVDADKDVIRKGSP